MYRCWFAGLGTVVLKPLIMKGSYKLMLCEEVKGAEGIVIHGDNIVLGMQKSKRWYTLENGTTASIIKTLGGAIEKNDNGIARNTLIRELLEEIDGLKKEDITVSQLPIFRKSIKMKDLNPYELNSNLNMEAEFFLVEISSKITLFPNDIPALIEIPINIFNTLSLAKNLPLENLKDYLKIKNINDIMPKNYALMIPNEVKKFLKSK